MPPRARKTAPAAEATSLEDSQLPVTVEAAEPKQPKSSKQAPPPLCEVCFPAGWPEDAYSAGCEHGSYLHPERAAAIGS